MTDQPWAQPQPPTRTRWQQLWGLPWPAKALLGTLAALLVVAAVLVAVNGSSDPGHVTKAQYDQWRVECEARATATLDTSLYQVGGNHWVDEVNRCLTAKAND